jgi:hypothetical protein
LAAKVFGAAKQISSADGPEPNARIADLLNVVTIVLSRATVSANSYQSALGAVYPAHDGGGPRLSESARNPLPAPVVPVTVLVLCLPSSLAVHPAEVHSLATSTIVNDVESAEVKPAAVVVALSA